MKTYKDFEKQYIGYSDIASLILAGYKKDEGLSLKELHFGEDNSYYAYIINAYDNDNIVEIPEHYKQVAKFDKWLKIYDDDELVKTLRAEQIIIYRAGEMGCIIELVD